MTPLEKAFAVIKLTKENIISVSVVHQKTEIDRVTLTKFKGQQMEDMSGARYKNIIKLADFYDQYLANNGDKNNS